jgi:hypothetical protein
LPKDDENIPFLEDLSSQPTEPAGFSHTQMVRCDECLRANPPTRVNCLYCGQALPLTDASIALVKPTLRPLESWEQGYNSVLLRLPGGEAGEDLVNQVAALLRLEVDGATRILSANRPLPLARAATAEEASLISSRLGDLGVETITVADKDLRIESLPPRRLRSLELRESEVVAYQAGSLDAEPIPWVEINLMVVGRLYVKQVEVRERKNRKRETKLLDAREFAADEVVLDFYADGREESWRISANGFDFSCLGESKLLLAGENFPRLINLFRECAPHAGFNDSYAAIRPCLEFVWPSEKRVDSGGLRIRAARSASTQIVSSNSEPQFTRYSRLCDYLKRKSLVPA